MLETMLKRVPFFSMLEEDQFQLLIEKGQQVAYQAGSIIFQEHDAADAMYIILSGMVKVYRQAEDEREVVVNTLQKGDFLGELALIDSEPRSATAVTVTPCQLMRIDQPLFEELISRVQPQVIFKIFRALTTKLRDATDKYYLDELERRSLEAQLEIERYRSVSQIAAGVIDELPRLNQAADTVRNSLWGDEIRSMAAQNQRIKSQLAQTEEAILLLQQHTHRAHTLAQDFKAISHRHLVAVMEQVDLAASLEQVIRLYQASHSHSVTLTNHLANPTWHGYWGYLSQAVLNALASSSGDVEIILSDTEQDFIITLRGQFISPITIAQTLVTTMLKGSLNAEDGLVITLPKESRQ